MCWSGGDTLLTTRARAYCLEMICADFLAGAHLEGGNPRIPAVFHAPPLPLSAGCAETGILAAGNRRPRESCHRRRPLPGTVSLLHVNAPCPVADLTLTNSSMFHLVPKNITDLTVERVKVRTPWDGSAPNTDAIDPGPGTNFWIHDCDIDTGDDDICIKSGGTNVLIENN